MCKEKRTIREPVKKVIRLIFLLFFSSLLIPAAVMAAEINYAKSKAALLKTLQATYIDKAYSQHIDHFYSVTCDSLIKRKYKLEDRPVKDILAKLFFVCSNNISSGSVTTLGIPAINHYFLSTLKAYKNGSVNSLFMGMNYIQSNILAQVFAGFQLGDSIKNIAGLREMLYDPYFISSRLELPQYAPYKDTLLYELANVAPFTLSKKLADNNSFYTTLVSNNPKITIRAVSQVKSDIYYDKMLPFSLAILQNRITEDEIKKLTLTPQDYYHAFVEEATRLHTSKEPEISAFLEQPIILLNKKFGNYYFIKQINELHESPDNVRFAVVNTLSAKELYFLMLAGSYDLVQEGSSALYTSSFLYLYKKFLKENEKEGLNKFFDDVDYYQFDKFISNLSDYGLVGDLVKQLDEEKITGFLANYLDALPEKQLTDNDIILDAVTLAEILYEIRGHEHLKNNLLSHISKIKSRPALQNNLLYQRIYTVLEDILLDKYRYETDKTYDILQVQRLQKQNMIVQASFFYDDEDAAESYSSCLTTYDSKTWDKKDKGNYIVFTSKAGNNMKVYMNKPNTKSGCDSAQNEMLDAIANERYEITSYIHRGHSYHLPQSLNKITASGQFVFLGSCGGYKQVLKIFQLNPNVNIIATRSVGSKLINDPLLEKINTEIVNNKDINWDILWQETGSKFQTKLTKDLFAGYTPPNKYIGIKFIRKVYNY
ncbi:MAG: hypothetical protein ACKOU7_09350 [Ferruginibacter sp.]